MKIKSQNKYLVLSTFGYLGDNLFQLGLPLYISLQSQSFFQATFFLLIISIATILAKPLRERMELKYKPLKLVGTIEIFMGIMELIVALMVLRYNNYYAVLAIFFIMALVYNVSVPTKRFVLYRFFFPEEKIQELSILQGSLEQIIALVAFVLIGILINSVGFGVVAILDAVTFFILGVFFLLKSRRHDEAEHFANKTNLEKIKNKSLFKLILGLSLIGPIYTLIIRLGQSFSYLKYQNYSLVYTSFIFSIFFAIGAVVSILLKNNKNAKSGNLYKIGFSILIFMFILLAIAPVEFYILGLIVSIVAFLSSQHMNFVRNLTNKIASIKPTDFSFYINFYATFINILFLPLVGKLLDHENFKAAYSLIAILIISSYVLIFKSKENA